MDAASDRPSGRAGGTADGVRHVSNSRSPSGSTGGPMGLTGHIHSQPPASARGTSLPVFLPSLPDKQREWERLRPAIGTGDIKLVGGSPQTLHTRTCFGASRAGGTGVTRFCPPQPCYRSHRHPDTGSVRVPSPCLQVHRGDLIPCAGLNRHRLCSRSARYSLPPRRKGFEPRDPYLPASRHPLPRPGPDGPGALAAGDTRIIGHPKRPGIDFFGGVFTSNNCTRGIAIGTA